MRFWKYASAWKPGRHSVMELLVNGNTVSTPKDIAAELSSQFESVFMPPDNALLPEAPRYPIEEPMQKITVVASDVESCLKLLNPNRSVGPDEVHPRELKEANAEIVLPLKNMFQKSLDNKQIPQDFWNANITPVHKGGSCNSVSNYKSISLTSVAGKILEGIMNAHIVGHLTTNELISDSQHGSRYGCSVDTKLVNVYNYITEHLDQAIPVELVLLDFAKVFDKLHHCQLRTKLFTIGIHNETIEWVLQFLSGRKQRVKIFEKNGQVFFSEEVEVLSGVPQGTILGPTLFNIYINDAPTTVKNKISLYAEDSKLIGPVDTPNKRASMHNDLWVLSLWAT